MKKLYTLLICFCLICLFSACITGNETENEASLLTGDSEETTDTAEEAGEQQADLIEERTLSDDVNECLSKYALVMDETFGVKIDDSVQYYRLYEETDTDYENIVGMISADAVSEAGIEAGSDGLMHYAGYIVDPSYASCYVALEHYSLDDIVKDFSAYIEEDVFMDRLKENFTEYGGFVYLVRGSRGYGAESFENAKISTESFEKVTVSADRYIMGEPDGTIELTFSVDVHRDPIVKLESVI